MLIICKTCVLPQKYLYFCTSRLKKHQLCVLSSKRPTSDIISTRISVIINWKLEKSEFFTKKRRCEAESIKKFPPKIKPHSLSERLNAIFLINIFLYFNQVYIAISPFDYNFNIKTLKIIIHIFIYKININKVLKQSPAKVYTL